MPWTAHLVVQSASLRLRRAPRKARELATGCLTPLFRVRDRRMIHRLSSLDFHLAQALAASLRRPFAQETIEAERAKLAIDETPLVSGALGSGGPYDAFETVATACSRSKPPRSAMLLYNLAQSCRPLRILELGTNVGISAAYLRSGQSAAGQLITVDASPYRIELAKHVWNNLALTNVEPVTGFFADVLPEVCRSCKPIEMAFIDGHHQYQATLDYFDIIYAHAAPNCIFVFDDIRWSPDMERAWGELKKDRRFSIVVDGGAMGVCRGGGARRSDPYCTAVLRTLQGSARPENSRARRWHRQTAANGQTDTAK
jgi:predicted O-methyltransferase YrrM